MSELQIENLYIYYFLYNGCDRSCDLMTQSPDYLLEKWIKIIGVEIPDTKYPEVFEMDNYKKWNDTWKRTNVILPDSLLMFLFKTHPSGNNGHYSKFLHLCECYQKYIGSTSDIYNEEEYNHIHPLLVKSVQKVVNRVVSKEDLREVILNNLLS